MLTAYQNEMKLMPYILAMEQRGVCLDAAKLAVDTDYYFDKLDELDTQICDTVGKQVDVDSNAALADAIEAAGLSKGFAQTPTGKRSTAKDSLIGAIDDPMLLGRLLVRGSIATCLRTFMQPWLIQANDHGKLFIRWNQIRNYTDTGARTGRLSSSPNLQNIPVTWEALRGQLKAIGYELEFELPNVRQYIIPSDGYVFVGRDYSAQEMKLLAHFTDGALLAALIADPTKDVHMIAAEIAGIVRKVAKTLGFAVLYGAGVGRIAETLGITVTEATEIKRKYLKALPEIKVFQDKLSKAGRTGNFVTTLGGRQYYVQAPAVVAGVMRSFEYKLTNYMIQGSAADQTKQAMRYFAEHAVDGGEIVLSVHDQLVIQCPRDALEANRELLKQSINGSYQEVLKYTVTSDEAIGNNFAECK